MNVYYNSKKLRLLAQTTQINTECEICNGLICPGWESLPVTLNPHLLRDQYIFKYIIHWIVADD